MKALSIQQPWAWLIVSGNKDIENRTWPTRFRGVFLVHAGKNFDHDGYQYIRSRHDITMPNEKDFPKGGIVGSAELVGCTESYDSQWFSGPYGFVLKECLPLPFESLPGSLRFFTVSSGLLGNLVGTVIKYDPEFKAAKVRLFHLISIGDCIIVRGSSNFSQQVRQMFRDGDQITLGIPGDSVWIEVKRGVAKGDQLYLLIDKPGEPEKPGKPDKPDELVKQDEPDRQDKPDKQDEPDKPNKPNEPNGPDELNGPDEPYKPDESDGLDEPYESDGPDESDETDETDDSPKLKPDLPPPDHFPHDPDETKDKGSGSGG